MTRYCFSAALAMALPLTACWDKDEPDGGDTPSDTTPDTTPDTGGDTSGDTGADTGTPLTDSDGDGYTSDVDCNDEVPGIHPGADEHCDDIDEDCNGIVDDDAIDAGRWYEDLDGDTWGDDATLVYACEAPGSTVVAQGGDCDPADGDTYPGATERCDGLDRDCDGSTADGIGVWHDGPAGWTDHTVDLATVTRAGLSLSLDGGTLHVCDGTWYTHLTVTADTTLVGHGAAPVLMGGGSGAVAAMTAGVDLTVENLTLTGGTGYDHLGTLSGGAIYCPGGGSLLTVNDTTIEGNSAAKGGGIYAVDCDVVVTGGSISDNTASQDGGGVYVHAYTQHTSAWFTEVSIADNDAATYGGGIAAFGNYSVDVDLYDSLVSGNTSTYGAGMMAHSWVTALCSGSTTVTAGFHDNTSTTYGALFLYSTGSTASLIATSCDMGTAGDDNAPTDVTVMKTSSTSYTYGDDASFSCGSDLTLCM